MTKREVEMEVEETRTVTKRGRFFVCDSCASEIENGGDAYKFYSFSSDLDPFHLCEVCASTPANSVAEAGSSVDNVGTTTDDRGISAEVDDTDELVGTLAILAVGFVIGFLLGAVIL